ncbi:MAG: hypothetical protein HKN39_06075 [Flavobacteriales bacterium]|nr:hypothetical protein [Flavobacteriales bacterium]
MRAARNFVMWILVISTLSFTNWEEEDLNKKVKLKVIAHTYQELNSEITLDIVKNGSMDQEDLSNSRNKFLLDLDLNESYDVQIKQPGCQGKVLKIDTSLDGGAKGNLSYVVEIFMKREVVGSLDKDEINFHLFNGVEDKTMLMLQDG